MSSINSSSVSITYDGSATTLNKSYLQGSTITRTSPDGLTSMEHQTSVTKKGRRRSAVKIKRRHIDSEGVAHDGQCTLVVDAPQDDQHNVGHLSADALVDFLNATVDTVDKGEIKYLVEQNYLG